MRYLAIVCILASSGLNGVVATAQSSLRHIPADKRATTIEQHLWVES